MNLDRDAVRTQAMSTAARAWSWVLARTIRSLLIAAVVLGGAALLANHAAAYDREQASYSSGISLYEQMECTAARLYPNDTAAQERCDQAIENQAQGRAENEASIRHDENLRALFVLGVLLCLGRAGWLYRQQRQARCRCCPHNIVHQTGASSGT